MAPGYVGMVGQSESGRVMQPKMQSFNEWTSAAEVARAYGTEVSGKTIIITGVGPDGLGVALCEAVAPHNPGLLILAGRDLGRVRTVAEAVSAKHPDLRTAVVRVDLASRESVRQAADEIGRLCDRVHVLVNNAGVMCIPHRTVTGDGTEMHLAVNYVGPFLLTRLIGKQLAAADPGRVVNVSSSSHTVSPFRFSDAQFDTPPATLPLREQPIPEACRHFGIPCTAGYAPLVAYGQSKTAGILHAKAIAGGAMGSRILAYSVNPGVIATNLWRHMPPDEVHHILESIPTKSPEQGAATILVAAFSPDILEHSGAYLEDCTVSSAIARHADNSQVAMDLWDWTERAVGLSKYGSC